MTTSCISTCSTFMNNAAAVSFNCGPLVSPAPFPVSVVSRSATVGTIYSISVGPVGSALTYTLTIDSSGNGTLTGVAGASVNFLTNSVGYQFITCGSNTSVAVPFAASTTFTLGAMNPFPTLPATSYSPGDRYVINVASCCNGAGINNLQATFVRQDGGSIQPPMFGTTGPVACTDCACFLQDNCGNIKVPIVSVTGQTNVDGSDVGDMLFTICDEFSYYKEEKLCHDNRCGIFYIKPEQVKQTIFRECCPKMVTVLKGVGLTLREKAQSIYLEMSASIGVPFDTFYFNIFFYGMVKYILSRLLYGTFNINFLLGKYNDKFLNDLGMSRFCIYLEFFNDCNSEVFGYNQYFKFGDIIKTKNIIVKL